MPEEFKYFKVKNDDVPIYGNAVVNKASTDLSLGDYANRKNPITDSSEDGINKFHSAREAARNLKFTNDIPQILAPGLNKPIPSNQNQANLPQILAPGLNKPIPSNQNQANLHQISQASQQGNFTSPQIQSAGKTLVNNKMVDVPRSRQADPITQAVMKTLLSPAQGAIQGVQGGVDTGIEAGKKIGQGEIGGGSLGLLNALVKTGFGLGNLINPAIAAFTAGTTGIGEVGGKPVQEAMQKVMSPVQTLANPQSYAGKQGAELTDVILDLLAIGGLKKGFKGTKNLFGNGEQTLDFPKGTVPDAPKGTVPDAPKGTVPDAPKIPSPESSIVANAPDIIQQALQNAQLKRTEIADTRPKVEATAADVKPDVQTETKLTPRQEAAQKFKGLLKGTQEPEKVSSNDTIIPDNNREAALRMFSEGKKPSEVVTALKISRKEAKDLHNEFRAQKDVVKPAINIGDQPNDLPSLEEKKAEEKNSLISEDKKTGKTPISQKQVANRTATVTDVTPEGYGPGEGETEPTKIGMLKGETADQAIERNVGYQIENGFVKLEETNDGWKATVKDLSSEKPSVIRATKKQDVLNLVFKELNPDAVFEPSTEKVPNVDNKLNNPNNANVKPVKGGIPDSSIKEWLDNSEDSDYVSYSWDGEILEVFKSRDKKPIEYDKSELEEMGIGEYIPETHPEPAKPQEEVPDDFLLGDRNKTVKPDKGAGEPSTENKPQITPESGVQNNPATKSGKPTGSKNPYEMTRKEYIGDTQNPDEKSIAGFAHVAAVKRAIKEGIKVSDEVLKSYPELLERHGSQAQPEKVSSNPKSTLNLRGSKDLGENTKKLMAGNDKQLNELFNQRSTHKADNSTPNEKLAALREANRIASELRSKGLNVEYGGGFDKNVRIDGKTLVPFDKPELTKVEDVKISDPKAEQSFEKMPQSEVDKQTALAEIVEPSDLDKGLGKKTIDKGIQDIKDDHGKELSPEAKAVRDAALQKGKDGVKIGNETLKGDNLVKAIKSGSKSELDKAQANYQSLQDDIFATPEEIDAAKKKVEKHTPERSRFVSEESYQKALENIHQNAGRLYAGLDPTMLKDLVTFGAYHLENGVMDFTDFSKRMIDEIGEEIKPHLQKVWDALKEEHKNLFEKAGKKSEEDVYKGSNADRQKQAEEEGRALTEDEKYLLKSGTKHDTDLLTSTKQKISNGDIKPGELAQKILNNKNPRISDEEQVALDLERVRLTNEKSQVNEKISEALKNGKDTDDLMAERARIEQAQITSDQASKKAGAETARSLRARQLVLNKEMELTNILSEARAVNSTPLSAKEESFYKDLVDKYEKTNKGYEAKLKEYEAKTKVLEAENNKLQGQDFVNRTLKKIALDDRQAKRMATSEALKAERGELYKQLYISTAKLTGANLFANPEPIKIIGELAENYIKDGVNRIENIVDGIYNDLKDKVDISKEDIHTAIIQYSKDSSYSEEQLKTSIGRAEREKKVLDAIENTTDVKRKTRLKQSVRGDISDATKLKAYRTMLENGIKDWKERLETGNYVKERKSVVKDILDKPENSELKKQLSELTNEREKYKEQVKNAIKQRGLDNLPTWQKGLNIIPRIIRAGYLTAVTTTLGKLPLYAALKVNVFNPAADWAGEGLGRIPGLRHIFEKGEVEGAVGLANESKVMLRSSLAWAKGFRELFGPEGKDILKTGKNSKMRMYNKNQSTPPELLDFFGHLHMLSKHSGFEGSFERSLQRRNILNLKYHPENDLNDLAVQLQMHKGAADDAMRDILLGDNRINELYNQVLGLLERKGAGGQIAKVGLQSTIPFAKVPTNFVLDTGGYVAGGIKAAATIGSKFVKGATSIKDLGQIFQIAADNMTPQEADAVARLLKKNTVGSGITTLVGITGMLLNDKKAIQLGGYYEKGQKRNKDDVAAGGMRIGDYDIPRWMQHSPALEKLQFDATWKKSYDKILEKSGVESPTTMDYVLAGLKGGESASMGLMDEIPFMNLTQGISPYDDFSTNAANFISNRVPVPPDVANFARGNDVPEGSPSMVKKSYYPTKYDPNEDKPIQRKPDKDASFTDKVIQGIELKIPGAREDVPEKGSRAVPEEVKKSPAYKRYMQQRKIKGRYKRAK